MERGLDRLGPRTRYAEALVHSSFGTSLQYDPTATTPTNNPRLSGVVFRAWAGPNWIEASTSRLTAPGIGGVVDDLLPRLERGNDSEPPGEFPSGKGHFETTARRAIADLSLDERVELVRRWVEWGRSVPGTASARAGIVDESDLRLFRSTRGAALSQLVTRVQGGVRVIAQEGGRLASVPVSVGGTGGFEWVERVLEADVTEAAREAVRLLRAPSPPSGRMAVLLDPSMTGIFAHESFGHGTEADQVLRNRSYLAPRLGELVGPESLAIVDDGSIAGGWGSIFFDDEGVRAGRTAIVERGRFTRLLHDRESASALKTRPTGNARRSDFLSRSFVRMTNTFIEGGDRSFEELVEAAGSGVVLERAVSGVEDPLGGQMQLACLKGHRIENGRLGELVGAMALSESVLRFLSKIRGIGSAAAVEMTPGSCGKGMGDFLPTGTGGPYLLSEAVVGPG